MTTRSKRTRGALAAAADAHGDHDFLLHMDPSLMTERQQLAFLLRKTAQQNGHADSASSGVSFDSASSGSESSDDEMPRRAAKKARRGARPLQAAATKASPKSPPPASREDLIAAALKNPAGLVLYCGRGRPPKNAIKLAPGEEMPADLKKLVETAAHHLRNTNSGSPTVAGSLVKNLRVKTAAETAQEASKVDEKALAERVNGSASSAAAREKTSPSSTNDLSHMQVFDDHGVGPDLWNAQCALCCRSNSPFGAPLEALFLCPTCDRKYPTQRALGLV